MSKFPEICVKCNRFEQLSEFSWNSGKIPWKFQQKKLKFISISYKSWKCRETDKTCAKLCEKLQNLSLERCKIMLILWISKNAAKWVCGCYRSWKKWKNYAPISRGPFCSSFMPEFHRNGQEMTKCFDILSKNARKIIKKFGKCQKFQISAICAWFHSSLHFFNPLLITGYFHAAGKRTWRTLNSVAKSRFTRSRSGKICTWTT